MLTIFPGSAGSDKLKARRNTVVKDTEALKRDEYVFKLGFITDPLHDLEKLAIELKFCKMSIKIALVFRVVVRIKSHVFQLIWHMSPCGLQNGRRGGNFCIDILPPIPSPNVHVYTYTDIITEPLM